MQKPISHLVNNDDKIRLLYEQLGELPDLPKENLYSFIVECFVGQMLSNKVAEVLERRLVTLAGDITPESISGLTIEDLRGIGLSYAKSQYIMNFTSLIISGAINLADLTGLSDEQVIKCLTSIKGIGVWTAQMVLLFALDRPNVLPLTDAAFINGFKCLYGTDEVETIKRTAKAWNPYCSLAARYIYEVVNQDIDCRNILVSINRKTVE